MTKETATQDWKSVVANTLNTLMGKINDAATLTVETRTYNIDSAAVDEKGKLIAKSVISIDGDMESGEPVNSNNEVNEPLKKIHHENLTKAIEYRADLIKTILDVVRQLGEMIEK